MKSYRILKTTCFLAISIAIFVSCDHKASHNSEMPPPHLEKRGYATQLIVKDKPFLVLGCELGNSTSSSREYMSHVWTKLKESGVNTVLAAVSWEQLEPE